MYTKQKAVAVDKHWIERCSQSFRINSCRYASCRSSWDVSVGQGFVVSLSSLTRYLNFSLKSCSVEELKQDDAHRRTSMFRIQFLEGERLWCKSKRESKDEFTVYSLRSQHLILMIRSEHCCNGRVVFCIHTTHQLNK